MGEVNGSYVTTVDGVDFYTDGIQHNSSSFSARIGYIDFSRQYDQITDEGSWEIGASTQNPVANIDNEGNVRIGGKYGVFDAGVVRFSDGTTGVFGGVSIGTDNLGLSYGFAAGGQSSGPHGNLSTYDHVEVFSDGSYARVEYSPADGVNTTGATVTRTEYNSDGTVKNTYVGSTTTEQAQKMAAGLAPHIYDHNGYWGADCFPAGTLISVGDGKSVPIESIRPDIFVSSFSERDDLGRGALETKPVVRLYTSVTQEFIRLDFADGRTPLHVTPGHVFLDETGSFTAIGHLVRLGGGNARIVDESGQIISVKATSMKYSAETAHMFERSSVRTMMTNGSVAFKEEVQEGWKTYNFEVLGWHTYVAGGVRVHNQSGTLGVLGNSIDNNFFDKLGNVGDAVGDVVSGAFHAAGDLVDGFVSAGQSLSKGFSDAAESFSNGDIIGGIADVGRGIGNAIGDVARGIGNAIGEVARGIGDAIGSVFGRDDSNDGQGSDRGKPIILDMDGDGIEIEVQGTVSFDMDSDGFLENTDWVDVDDAFLVIDLNADGSRGTGDGKIDQTAELVLSEWLNFDGATDLQALALFDTSAELGGNNDSVLSNADAVWSELRVWQDANLNGVSDAGELKTLDELGFTQINLTYDDETHYSDQDNNVQLFNSSLLGTASYIRNGQTVLGGVGDVAVSYVADGTKRVETDIGFDLVFETGQTLQFATTGGKSSSSVDLAANGLDGAYGDARANHLSSVGVTKSVDLKGFGGNDTLQGGNASDLLMGGSGADVLDGQGGTDTASYLGSNAAVLINLLQGFGTGGHAEGDTLSHIENLIGSIFGDTLNGSTGANIIQSGDGDDEVWAHGGNDIVHLGLGNDVSIGGRGNDKVFGEDGNDNIYGSDGKDELYGGAGNDRLVGQKDDDSLYGGAGEDLIRGGSWDDIVDGGKGNDTLYGDTGSDRLIGGFGDDIMTGGSHGTYLDVFVFAKDNGTDVITDFEIGEDRIEFTIAGLNFADLIITDTSSGARIAYDDDDIITLTDVTANQLRAEDFIFS
ncbi:hypothetical protein [uncultured Tateyamaria sp.]|uniref:hypothetical protein n=1 Tax=uncultured Tateyamaria sp. TaxID=455651 RepID=UPI002633D508|nr:hypothetical protein [uncultured Tateyamaria sp.]